MAGGIARAPPYLRGPRAVTMYANRPWTIRRIEFSTAEVNRFCRDNLKAGQMGLSTSTSPPTAATTATTRASSAISTGRCGAIDSVEDMKILFDGIPLDKMSVSMTMNGAVLPVLAGFIVAAEEQGVRGSAADAVQNDI